MPRRVRLLFSVLSLSLFVVAAVPLFREFVRRPDIWWTPHAMLVPLGQSTDRVEIYVRGKSFAGLLDAGQILVAGEGGPSALANSDVGVRFNNWDRVRAERIPTLLVAAAGCGFTACLLLLIVTGRLAYRSNEEPAK